MFGLWHEPSVSSLSVVCNVVAHYTQSFENFGNIFAPSNGLGTQAVGIKLLGEIRRGSRWSRELNEKGGWVGGCFSTNIWQVAALVTHRSCPSVRSFVRLFVAKMHAQNAVFSKTKQFRAMVSIDDLSPTWAFQQTQYWTTQKSRWRISYITMSGKQWSSLSYCCSSLIGSRIYAFLIEYQFRWP